MSKEKIKGFQVDKWIRWKMHNRRIQIGKGTIDGNVTYVINTKRLNKLNEIVSINTYLTEETFLATYSIMKEFIESGVALTPDNKDIKITGWGTNIESLKTQIKKSNE